MHTLFERKENRRDENLNINNGNIINDEPTTFAIKNPIPVQSKKFLPLPYPKKSQLRHSTNHEFANRSLGSTRLLHSYYHGISS